MRRAAAELAAGAALVGAGLLLTLPVLVRGFPPEAHDSWFHAVSYEHFAQQLWGGEPYPRWLGELNLGLGAPVMFYYPPAAYYLTAGLRPLFRADPQAWHQLGASASLGLILSGLLACGWLRGRVERLPALVAALLYMALPYHLLCDLYLRAAFAELWAFAWLPLVLWQIDRVARLGPPAIPGLALAWALLLATHLHSALMFAPVALGYAVAASPRTSRARSLAGAVLGLALGAGVSAIYLIPAALTQDSVYLPELGWRGALAYPRQFLFAGSHAFPDFEPVLTRAVGVTGGLAVAALALGGRPAARQPLMAFWALVALASFALLTPASRPVWEWLPILQKLQFPWRFAVILTLATAALSALGLDAMRHSSAAAPARVARSLVALAALGLLGTSLDYTAAVALATARQDRSAANRSVARGLSHPVFFPVWSYRQRPELREALLRGGDPRFDLELPYLRKFGPHPPRAQFESDAGEVSALAWEPRSARLRVRSARGGGLLVWRLYYPGWEARLVGAAGRLPLRPSDPDGLVRVEVPAGEHTLALRLAAGPEERAGAWLSGAALLATGGLALAARRRRRSTSGRAAP